MNLYYFRINIGKKCEYIFPERQVIETATQSQASQNLGDGLYAIVEREKYLNLLGRETYSSENLYTYNIYNKYGKFVVGKNGWKLARIEEFKEPGYELIVKLHIEDQENVEHIIKCYIYEASWKNYNSRFIYVLCSSINYFLHLSEFKSWTEEVKQISKLPSALYKTHNALFMEFLHKQ